MLTISMLCKYTAAQSITSAFLPVLSTLAGRGWMGTTRTFSSGVALRSPLENGHPKSKMKITDEFGLLPILPRIESLVGKSLNFPYFVTVGGQSTGKSSLLEAILGIEIFPKGNSMVSRCPLKLVLENVRSGTYVKFEDGEVYYDMEMVQKRILEENLSIQGVSPEPLTVYVYSDKVNNMTVYDLPGIIENVDESMGYSANLPDLIADITVTHISNPNNIILGTMDASRDLENSLAIKYTKAYKDRVMGLLTKTDLRSDKSVLQKYLSNKYFRLEYGYMGACLRNNTSIEKGVTLEQQIAKEKEYHDSLGFPDEINARLGIENIRYTLSDILLKRTASQLPNIIDTLDRIIEETERNQDFLLKLSKEPDLNTVATDLELLVKQLNENSPDRADFENDLRCVTHSKVIDFMADNNRPFPTLTEEMKKESVYPGAGRPEGKNYDMDRALRLEIFGESTLENVDMEVKMAIRDSHNKYAAMFNLIDFKYPNDQNRTRTRWHRYMRTHINTLCNQEERVSQIIFDTTMDELKTFINSSSLISNSQQSQLARLFLNFLTEKIGNKIYKDGLGDYIDEVFAGEVRIEANLHGMSYQLCNLLEYPSSDDYSFLGRTSSLQVDAYGDAYTHAYLADRSYHVADQIFKKIGSQFLDPLVLEALKYTLNMFRSETLAQEAGRQTDKLDQLREHRVKLLEAAKFYCTSEELSQINLNIDRVQQEIGEMKSDIGDSTIA